jgi:hypothetical protein
MKNIISYNNFLREGTETTQVVGSGTKVGGGAVGKYTKSAGQAVGGGDSPSSFSSNSNSTKFEMEIPVGPHHIFDERTKRKKKKDKTERIYNKKGEIIDNLYKIKNENMIKNWEEFSKLNEDGEGGGDSGGGISSSSLGNTSGMGAIVSAQPSSIPGNVQGSTKGSGDISRTTLGPYSKTPQRSKNKRKKKKKLPNDNIDNFYVTKYTEQNNYGGKMITNWKTFTENKINEYKEYDFSHPDLPEVSHKLNVPNHLPQKYDEMECVDNEEFEELLTIGKKYTNLGYSSLGDKVFVLCDNDRYRHVSTRCFGL